MTAYINSENTEWAYNHLWISADKNNRASLAELFDCERDLVDDDDGNCVTFYNHKPVPDCLVELYLEQNPLSEEDCYNECGYKYLHDFTLNEWGCVLDAKNPVLEHKGDDVLHYTFQTRSNSPLIWMKDLSEWYPNLTFELESSNEFELFDEFTVVYSNGKQGVFKYNKKQRN